MGVFTHKMLRAWAVCPRCCNPYQTTSCPICCEADAERSPAARTPVAPASAPASALLPRQESASSGVAASGLALGALGLVPLLGLAFSVLGVILSLAALRSEKRQGRSPRLALCGLALSLTTSVPGVLIWGWLQSASAAW